MKTKIAKVSVIVIIMITVFLPITIGQGNFGDNHLSSWEVAEFAGTLKNKTAFYVYYNSEDNSTIYSNGLMYLETLNIYTKYGKRHHKAFGVKSRKIVATINVWVVDIQNNRFYLGGTVDTYKNGDVLTNVINKEDWKWISPTASNLGEYYLKLAKKISSNLNNLNETKL